MRKFLLLICIAFTFFAFCWPCTIFPFTNYTCTVTVGDLKTTQKFNFKLNGKVDVTSVAKLGEEEQENKTTMFYKISFKNKTVKMAEKKEDLKDATPIKINNIYSLGTGVEMKNKIAMWTSVGVGAVAVLLVLTIPGKRKNK